MHKLVLTVCIILGSIKCKPLQIEYCRQLGSADVSDYNWWLNIGTVDWKWRGALVREKRSLPRIDILAKDKKPAGLSIPHTQDKKLRHMVREWKEGASHDGGGHQGFGNAVILFWVALITLSLMSAIIFSCSDGASKDKASATQTDGYQGTGCTACGGACGAWTRLRILLLRNEALLEICSCFFCLPLLR